MNRTVTWLHLSDLHSRLRDDWDLQRVSDALLRDLQIVSKEHGLHPDFIFFTGDIAFGACQGKRIVDQYQKAKVFFETVRSAFNPEVSIRDLYLVPGNHDVDRGEITAGEMDWLRKPGRHLDEVVAAARDQTKQWRIWLERLGSYKPVGWGHVANRE